MVHEYEDIHSESKPEHKTHHEQNPSTQRRFHKNVQDAVDTFRDAGNPFLEDSADLLRVESNTIMSSDVVNSVKTAKLSGQAQYQTFVEERLRANTLSIYDRIQRNNLPLFKSCAKKGKSKEKQKLSSAMSDVQLFSRLFISCQVRGSDLDAFFDRENHPWPPALADGNEMRHTNKSELVTCLLDGLDTT